MTDLTLRRIRSCEEQACNIINNAKRFHWQSLFVNSAFNELRSNENYAKLTIRDKHTIEGYIDCLRDSLKSLITHAYYCNDGKFRPDPKLIGYEKYDYPSSRSAKTIVEETCVLVWADKPSMVWYCDDETLEFLKTVRAEVSTDAKGATMVLESMVNRCEDCYLEVETELHRRRELYRGGATIPNEWTVSVSSDRQTVHYYYRHYRIDAAGQIMG